MKTRYFSLFIVAIIMVTTAQAQTKISVSKNEILKRVQENNTSLKISEQNYQQARADYKQTNAVFLPNITASHTGIVTTNPLMAFGSKLNQEILTSFDELFHP